jgi:predicted RNA-binding Zn-ribbon protein involved in translation (DUF1610 family)
MASAPCPAVGCAATKAVSMDITFGCESCGQSIVIDEAGVGLTVPCPNCGQSLTVSKATAAKTILAVAPTPIDPALLYTLFRGRGPSKVTQIIGGQLRAPEHRGVFQIACGRDV